MFHTKAAHFGQHQVSIFTAALWHQQQLKTFAIVSDSLDHTKTSVVTNITKILEILPAIVKLVHIHSDNATSQFKKQKIQKFLHSCEVRVWWLSEKKKARRNVDIGLKKIIGTSKKLKNISKNHYFSVINATVQIQRLTH